MSETIWQNNQQALRQREPALAARIEALTVDPQRYRVEPSSSGKPTLKLAAADGSLQPALDPHDPQTEAQQTLENIDHSEPYVPFLVGIGLGYTARLLSDHYGQEWYDMLLFEADAALFKLALQTTPLHDLIANPRVRIQVGFDPQPWTEKVHGCISGIMSSRLETFHSPAATALPNPGNHQAEQIVQRRVQLAEAEFDLMIKSGAVIQENLWRNLPAILHSYGYRQLAGLWPNQPAFVVAAGPSLDRNAEQLRAVQDRFPILAVDTALRTLLHHGIVPHLAVSTDATALNQKHFEDLEIPPETALAYDAELYWQIPNHWPGKRFYCNLEKSVFTRWIEQACGPYGYLPKGVSVGHTAFYLARAMGANPIVLVGLDLAFDAQGGHTHTEHSALLRTHEQISAGSQQAPLGPRYGSDAIEEDIVWVDGYDGAMTPTSRVMSLYIQQFADEIAKTPSTVIDATEGGALIPGARVTPLHEVIGQLETQPPATPFPAVLESLAPLTPKTGTLVTQLQTIQQHLTQAGELAVAGLQHCASLQPHLERGLALRHTQEWAALEDLFNQVHSSEAVKISLEQALFEALYRFIRKEHPHQVADRLAKYQHYFQSLLVQKENFMPLIGQTAKQLQTPSQ